jgi:hypothetical protein
MTFTDMELASMTWEAMYPDRRKFHELEQSTKNEWAALARITRDFLIIERNANSFIIKYLKEQNKV